MNIKNLFNNDFKNIIFIVLLTFFSFLLLHNICDSSIFDHTLWDSYELQADSWLNGRLDVDNNEGLELAIYKGKYYVSFPPLPSLIVLPFVLVFGVYNTPSNFIIFMIILINIIVAYKILRKHGTNEFNSILLSIGLLLGSNMLSLSMNGGVWFLAQALNLLFCTIAVGYLLDSKKALTYFFLALAVGCRPFSAIYIIAAFLFFALKDMGKPWKEILLKNLQPLIPMILIAIIYMSYNYVRFNNPLEFGHNYLPEFTRIEDDNYGQFSINYLWNNIKTLLSMKLPFDEKPDMIINSPFMFFIANPIFLVCVYDGVIKIIKYKKISLSRFIFSIAMIINFICICLHKTLGGWQFGARYTCDLMAFAFLDLFLYRNKNTIENNSTKKLILKDESIGIISLNKFEIALIIFGIIFNVYGAIELWLSV